MEWKGLAARLRRIFHIRCGLTGAWNGRRVNCIGLLRGPVEHAAVSLRRVVSFRLISLLRSLAGGGGLREFKKCCRKADRQRI